jgi:hypothetical protein
MAIALSPESSNRLRASIQRYFREEVDQDIGDLEGACYEREFTYWRR